MLKQKPTVAQMKALIKEGISIEVLSTEFELPMNQLEQLRNLIITEQKKQQIDRIKNKYNLLYRASRKSSSERSISKDDETSINQTIAEVQEQIDNNVICNLWLLMKICTKIKNIKALNFSYEQAFEIYKLLNCEKIKQANLDQQAVYYKKQINEIINFKIAEAAKRRIEESEDIENIQRIKKDICSIDVKYDLVLASAKNLADRKINELRNSKAMENISFIKSEKLRNIIKNIADGTVNIEEAKNIIREEAQKKMATKKTSLFWNQNNEEQTILYQMINLLKRKAINYPIQRPTETIKQLEQLGIDLNQAITVVVNNMIERKEFKSARKLCNVYEFVAEKNNISVINLKKLKSDIRNAEVSDLAKKLLQLENTSEEDEIYFDTLRDIIAKEKIDLSKISLGTSSNGTAVITLERIWPSDRYKIEKNKY